MKSAKRKSGLIVQDKKVVLKSIGDNLKKRRKILEFTSGEDFAYEYGINRSQYGKYEAGSQDMQIGTLLKIVNAMGLTLQEFFSEDFE